MSAEMHTNTHGTDHMTKLCNPMK